MPTGALSLLIRLDDGTKLRIPVEDHDAIPAAVKEAEERLSQHWKRPIESHPWLVENRPVKSQDLINLLRRKFLKSNCSTIRLNVNNHLSEPHKQMVGLGKRVDAMYNVPAEALLESQVFLHNPNRVSATIETGLSIKEETVLDKVHNLQNQSRDGTLCPSLYEAQLKSLLEDQFTQGPSSGALLKSEIDKLRPQLFCENSESAPQELSKWRAEESHHRDLHTMHVLPLINGKRRDPTPQLDNQDHSHHATQQITLPLHTWEHFKQLLSDCHSRTPLLFPHTVVVTMALHHSELLGGIESAPKEGLLVESGQDVLCPLLKDFARVGCAVMKELLGNSKEPSEIELLTRTRKILKSIFHDPASTSRRSFQTVLTNISLLINLYASQDSNLALARRLCQRLFFKLALNDSVHCSEAVRRLAKYTQDEKTLVDTQEEDRVSLVQKCVLCNKELICLCVQSRRGPECVSCWLNDQETSRDDKVTRLVSSTPHETPVPATHLLTHQRNLWENKTGTRHAKLPDERHAVISTAVHHLVRRRAKIEAEPPNVEPPNRTTSTTVPSPTAQNVATSRPTDGAIKSKDEVARDTARMGPKIKSLSLDSRRDKALGGGEEDGFMEALPDSEKEDERFGHGGSIASGLEETDGAESCKVERGDIASDDMIGRRDGDGQERESFGETASSTIIERVSSSPSGSPGPERKAKAGHELEIEKGETPDEPHPTAGLDPMESIPNFTEEVNEEPLRREAPADQKSPRTATKTPARTGVSNVGTYRGESQVLGSAGNRSKYASGDKSFQRTTRGRGRSSAPVAPSLSQRSYATDLPTSPSRHLSASGTYTARSRPGTNPRTSRQSCPALAKSQAKRSRRDELEELNQALTQGVADPLLARLLAGTRPARRRQL